MKKFLLVVGASCLVSGWGYALINPNFTPVELVNQSKLVARVTFERVDEKKGTVLVKSVEALKGKFPANGIELNLFASPYKENAKMMMGRMKQKEMVSLLFIGEFSEGGEEGGGEGGAARAKGFLCVGGDKWLLLYRGKGKNVWEMDKVDEHMLGTWNGGGDMLLRCVKYILSDEDAEVPVNCGVEWEDYVKVGKVTGKVCGMQPVMLSGGGWGVFVGSSAGDVLVVFEKKGKKARFSLKKLPTASSVFTWGDFDGDGTVELLSFSGTKVRLLKGIPGGKASMIDVSFPLEKVAAAVTVDVGGGRASVAACGTSAYPVVASFDGKSAFKGDVLCKKKEFPAKKTGPVRTLLAADFDGDGVADLMQVCRDGSLFYRGGGSGFSVPRLLPVSTGERGVALVGDFDADGMFDILCPSPSFPTLWHNYGNLRFKEAFAFTGESSYIAKPGAVGGCVGDINNDGRQDFLLIYGKGTMMKPQIFFNRGFRSFGHAHKIDLAEQGAIDGAEEGQQAGLLFDVDDDGDQDMLLVLENGEVWWCRMGIEEPIGVKVRIKPGKAGYGPVKVSGKIETRSLGAWNVVPGCGEAFFGITDAEPVTCVCGVGGKAVKKTFEVENEPVKYMVK